MEEREKVSGSRGERRNDGVLLSFCSPETKPKSKSARLR